ncbi:hypothetical protein GCM10027270_34840 [Nocardioides ginkgobilobae]
MDSMYSRDGVLAMPVTQVFDMAWRGTALMGTIAQGSVRTDDTVLILGGEYALAVQIFVLGEDAEVRPWADAGDTIGGSSQLRV